MTPPADAAAPPEYAWGPMLVVALAVVAVVAIVVAVRRIRRARAAERDRSEKPLPPDSDAT